MDDDDEEEAFLRAYTLKGRRVGEELPASESILTPQSPLQAELSKYFARILPSMNFISERRKCK